MAANLIVVLAASGLVASAAPVSNNTRSAAAMPVAKAALVTPAKASALGCTSLTAGKKLNGKTIACEKVQAGPNTPPVYGFSATNLLVNAAITAGTTAAVIAVVPPASSR
ncbi:MULTISPECIES: hypothetical protein [unclassified Novosphingobium]|uniref:hypothetical protein n=1 Tax=unclassified Novosphingobium TaxID=2644732 RepID=UPI00086C533C|nr:MULTISPECIES: hypothetical protein [unclassified Novosphingobium]MBN9142829.1 hypothetical protein [Novosphingobium sp.]MDR6705914.1 hypothetical protein [Novosphingobium sp. 1748]ODU85010.1 MAG: hypothetical protein ABT10_01830 [Novosphingobium sp. SCN 63-17]OJX89211.1 MAG: hypothetical protein BGP00_13250 [Novosphingobium sp. 63-713]